MQKSKEKLLKFLAFSEIYFSIFVQTWDDSRKHHEPIRIDGNAEPFPRDESQDTASKTLEKHSLSSILTRSLRKNHPCAQENHKFSFFGTLRVKTCANYDIMLIQTG